MKGYPLSVVVLLREYDSTFHPFFVVATSAPWALYFLKITEGGTRYDKSGFLYFPVEILEEPAAGHNKSLLAVAGYKFHCYRVMIPDLWIGEKHQNNCRYAVISEDWEQLDEEINKWTTAF